MAEIVFAVLGVLCFAYFLVCGFYAGFGASFLGIWPAAGILLLLFSAWLHMDRRGKLPFYIPGMLRMLLTCVVLSGIFLFLVMEGLIFSKMYASGPEGLNYIVVLGAQVRGDHVSVALEERLVASRDYLQENPETKAVLSGGQGPGENLTEAQAMFDWLTENGIGADRLIMEAASTSTWENLVNSRRLIEEDQGLEALAGSGISVGIVTNNFHVYRGTMLASCAEYPSVYGIAARSHSVMQVHFLVREGLALFKDMIKYRI